MENNPFNVNSHFNVSLPIIEMENNYFKIDENINRIMFDVGTSWNAPNSVKWLNSSPSGLVLGFEPSLDEHTTVKALPRAMFAAYKAPELWIPEKYKCKDECIENIPQNDLIDKYAKDEPRVCKILPLKDSHRFKLFPCAIGIENKFVDFNGSAAIGGVGSVLQAKNPNYFMNKYRVPMIRLDEIIKRIPPRFEYIEHLKIDAQGYDDQVIISAGELIKRCAVVSAEVPVGQYIGEGKVEMRKYMESNGFEYIGSSSGCYQFLNSKFKQYKNDLNYELFV